MQHSDAMRSGARAPHTASPVAAGPEAAGFAGVGTGFGRVVQVAYLVPDVDAAMAHWVRHAGVGPWTCIRNIRLDAIYDESPER